MASTIEEFVQRLTDSGLMTAAEVISYRDSLSRRKRSDTAEAFAETLVKSGKLTEYQSSQLLNGNSTSLMLGAYKILEKIGEGGMGEVFKAQHVTMDRIVALKTLPPKSIKAWDGPERFKREIKATAKLNHPNIVTAHDAGEQNGLHFLVMEYVEGVNLHGLCGQNGQIPVDQAVNFVVQTARGLAYAHQQNIIHRDIKPANLLLHTSGTIKILDLGLARPVDTTDDLTTAGEAMGTVDYMAPEQALDAREADRRSDIYSLGCTLYYLLARKPVYPEQTRTKTILSHRDRPIPSIRDVRPDVPQWLDQVFQKMIAKSPDERYQTMEDVIAALGTDFEVQQGPLPQTPSPSRAADPTATFFNKEVDGTDRNVPTTPNKPRPATADAEQPGTGKPKRLRIILIIPAVCMLAALVVWQMYFHGAGRQLKPPVVDVPPSDPKAGPPINLLAMIQPQQAATEGEWDLDDGKLIAPTGMFARMTIPYRPPASYQLEMTVVPKQDQTRLAIGLVIDGRQVAVLLGDWKTEPGDVIKLEGLDGMSNTKLKPLFKGKFFERDVPTTIVCSVSPGHLTIQCNDEAVEWSGNADRFLLPPWWQMPVSDSLFLGTFELTDGIDGTFDLTELKLTELDGTGAIVDTASPQYATDCELLWASRAFYVYSPIGPAEAEPFEVRIYEAEDVLKIPGGPGRLVEEMDGTKAWAVDPDQDDAGFFIAGEYIRDIPAGGPYEAVVRVKTEAAPGAPAPPGPEIANFEMHDFDLKAGVSKFRLFSEDCPKVAEYREWRFPFYCGTYANVQLRSWWTGLTKLSVDNIRLVRAPADNALQWNVTVSRWEPARATSWRELDDGRDKLAQVVQQEVPLLSLHWPASDLAFPIVTHSTGKLSMPAGKYLVEVDSAGALRVQIDDNAVIEDWFDDKLASPARRKVVTLTGDAPHSIRIDHASRGSHGDETYVQFFSPTEWPRK